MRRNTSMAMNPAMIMKIMKAKNTFESNHPRCMAFLQAAFGGGMEAGTVIEMTVTKPGQAPMTTNIRVQQSDLDILEELKELGK